MDKTKLQLVISELWHLSKTALAAMPTVPTRHDRMIYIKTELKRTYPDLIEGMTTKQIWFAIEDNTTVF